MWPINAFNSLRSITNEDTSAMQAVAALATEDHTCSCILSGHQAIGLGTLGQNNEAQGAK